MMPQMTQTVGYYSVMLGRTNFFSLNSTQIIWHSHLLQPPEWVFEIRKDKRWWEMQMALLLFCPKDDIVQMAESLKIRFGWTDRMIGMHGKLQKCFWFLIHSFVLFLFVYGLVRRGDRRDLHKYSLEVHILFHGQLVRITCNLPFVSKRSMVSERFILLRMIRKLTERRRNSNLSLNSTPYIRIFRIRCISSTQKRPSTWPEPWSWIFISFQNVPFS